MTIHAYLRPAAGEGPPFKEAGAASPAAKAVAAYAASLGEDRPTYWLETSLQRPSRLAERTIGAEMLRVLRQGDTLLACNVADLCDFPSDLDALVRALAGRGIELQLASLANASHSRVLKAAVEAFAPLEGELNRARAELAQVQRIADARLELHRVITTQQLIENRDAAMTAWNMGVPSTVGDVTAPLVNGGVGSIIRAKREAKGMSQGALAKVLGTTQPTISKLEAGESHHLWQEALAYLTGGENASA